MLSVPGQNFSFVVRVRLETDPAVPQRPYVLRGSLQLLGSTEVRYFATLDDIPKILRELTAPPDGADQTEDG